MRRYYNFIVFIIAFMALIPAWGQKNCTTLPLKDANYWANKDTSLIGAMMRKEEKGNETDFREMLTITEQLRSTALKLKSKNDSITKEIQQLNDYKKKLSYTFVNDNISYLSLPFDKMDTVHMNRVIARCNKLKADEGIKEMGQKYTAMFALRERYCRARSLLDTTFDSNKIQNSLGELKAGNYNICTPVQKGQVETLIKMLSIYYPQAQKNINEIVKQLNKQLDVYTDKNNKGIVDLAHDDANQVFIQNLTKEETINQIPFLKEQYARFKEEVLKDPIDYEEKEKDILHISI